MASTKRYFDPSDEKDAEILRKMLEDVFSDNEVADDETDSDEESVHDQMEVDEEEYGDSSDVDLSETLDEEGVPYFIGKDRKTKWRKDIFPKNVRTRSVNLLTKLPGVIGAARSAKTELESWKCFICDDILEILVRYTNKYIISIQSKFNRERDAKTTDLIEMKAFIGLLYFAGLYKSNRQNLDDLWSSDGMGVELFRLVMSERRFRFLIRCLRFDDRETRLERKSVDKLAAVREIFSIFVRNCQTNYSLGTNVTIDEKLEAFRGRCQFRQYIPSKPNKYGIKIFAMVDAKLLYTSNLEIYAGQQPEGPFRKSNRPVDIVMRLTEMIYNTGRNITADNWFTSLELLQKLKEKKLSYVGTIRKNKPELPLCFVSTKNRPQNSSMFGFSESGTIVSYIPKKGKNVVLLSSMHYDDVIDVATGDQAKPEIITFYNGTKSGVDLVDEMSATYNCARNTRRWPMVIFYTMLNIAALNAQIVYIGNQNEIKNRRSFLKKLIMELVIEQITRRKENVRGLPRNIQEKLAHVQEGVEKEQDPKTGPSSTRKRCLNCYKSAKRTRLTKYQCKKCGIHLCLDHANMVCEQCLNKDGTSSDD